MKHTLASIVAVAFVLLATVPNSAQEVVRERLDPSTSLVIFEIGAIASLEDGAEAVTLGRLFPKEMRPEENHDLDVKKGDEILMMNGERIRSISTLRELYQGLEIGDEVKLGLKRDSQRFLVRFDKSENQMASSHGGGMRVVVAGGDGEGEVELLHEARALLADRDGGVTVAATLGGGELEEGDVVSEIDGQSIASLEDYRTVYEKLEIGAAFKLTVQRDDESFDVDVAKAERPAGMMMRGQ